MPRAPAALKSSSLRGVVSVLGVEGDLISQPAASAMTRAKSALKAEERYALEWLNGRLRPGAENGAAYS